MVDSLQEEVGGQLANPEATKLESRSGRKSSGEAEGSEMEKGIVSVLSLFDQKDRK
jgi:hypothetical protein